MDAARLRTATEAEHRRLEAELDLLRPSLTLVEYVELLARFHAFYSLWEKETGGLIESALPGFFEERKKVFRLEADLTALNYHSDDSSWRRRCGNVPRMDNSARALGSLYVIEGSTLGGQILARHFRGKFGLEPDSGCAFFSGYGDRTSEMWRAFREVLAQRPASEEEDMIESAVATFRALRVCLAR